MVMEMVDTYPRARNTKTMPELYTNPRTLDKRELAKEHNILEWENFVEGRKGSFLKTYYQKINISWVLIRKTLHLLPKTEGKFGKQT